jgi:ethanolamine permease
MGWTGVLAALPFAVWLFLAIEELPLAAEESVDPKRDMPKGLIFGMFTLIVSALMIMLLNASIGAPEQGRLHGSFSLGSSAEPLLDGFRVIYPDQYAKLLSLFAVIGLIASFHTIIFAYGRQIYSLSRAGYYPGILSVTHGSRKTPHLALITGTAMGLAIIMAVWFALGAEKGGALIGATLLNMAVFGAMISYAFQGLSFIQLRRKMPNIERPYRSPLGHSGRERHGADRTGDALLPIAGSGVPQWRLCRACLVCARHPVLRFHRPAQARALARGRVRDHRRPPRPSGARRLRHDQGVTTRY